MWYYSYDYVIWQKGDYLGRWAYSNCRSPLKAEFGLASARESCRLEDERATNIQAGRGGAESGLQLTASKGVRTPFLQPQESNSVNQLKRLGSGFFPRASREAFRLSDLLISACETLSGEPHGVHCWWPRGYVSLPFLQTLFEKERRMFIRMQSQLLWQRPKWQRHKQDRFLLWNTSVGSPGLTDGLVLGTQFPSVLGISIPRLLTLSCPKWLHTMSHSRHLAGKYTCTLARTEAHGHTWLQGRLGNAVSSWAAMNLASWAASL